VSDVDALPYLLHGRETRVWGDQGYQGQTAVIRARAPRAKDFTNRKYRGTGWVNELQKAKNRTKSRVRAKVEHTIGVIKRVFGFQKVRYRGSPRTCTVWKSPRRWPISTQFADGCCMRRRGVSAERKKARFGMTNVASATETAPLVVLDTKSLPMTVFMTSSSELP